MIEALGSALAAWIRAAESMPWRSGLVALALSLVIGQVLAGLLRARLELTTDRVAAGPIFALAGVATLAVGLSWWSVDAILWVAGQPLVEQRLLELASPEAAASLRPVIGEPDGRLLPPAAVHLPVVVMTLGSLYLAIVLWVGRTLVEMTSLEQKPPDILARERRAQKEAIDKALKEGRPVPAEAVISVPLADDRLGRVFKLLGHWTSVELVEERFQRWQRPLVDALSLSLLLSLPAALGGHLGAPLWAGAALALDGLRKNLRTKQVAPPKEEAAAAAPPAQASRPPLQPLLDAVHGRRGVVATLPLVDPQGAQLSPGTDLSAKRVVDELRSRLSLDDGLYVHQGLACDAFAARKNVLVTTPPLSGRQVLAELLVFYALLVDAENVLVVSRDADEARQAEERFRARARAARWHWNVASANVAGRASAVDLARAQPTLLFTDPQGLHAEICAKAGDWAPFVASLGLVVVADIDRYDGPQGAHLSHLCRRLRRAAGRAAPMGGAEPGDRVRFVATAPPLYRELGRFAERIVGRPFHVIGPEVDGAPLPACASYVLSPLGAGPPAGAEMRDLHPAVLVLGEALAQGFAAELFGFEDLLATSDVARANEVMIARGVATRGRALSIGTERWGASVEALAAAEVVVARASAPLYPVLPLLLRHLGMKSGAVPPARVASLGAGERVGRGAAPVPKKEEPPPVAVGDDGAPLVPAAPELKNAVVALWQPDADPFALLLATERPPPSHPDLAIGRQLVVDPSAEVVQRAHLIATLREGPAPRDELERDFAKSVLEAALAGDGASGGILVEDVRREIDATGAVRQRRFVALGGGRDGADDTSLETAGPPASVVDRHSGEVLLRVARERGACAAYPGRALVQAGRRFAVSPPELQDRLAEHILLCEREDRPVWTSRIRALAIQAVERRGGGERRAAGRDDAERRSQPARSLGGVGFQLEHRAVAVDERVLGLYRFGPDGRERDATAYDAPMTAAFASRAAVLAFPKATCGDIDAATLHALAHLVRVTLPAFVRFEDGDDLDVVQVPAGAGSDAALALVDLHPGGAGFADAITLDVLGPVLRWSLALASRCPARCNDNAGCPSCLRIISCHSEPARRHDLDRAGAVRVLRLLLG